MKYLIIITACIFLLTLNKTGFAQSSQDEFTIQVDGLGCPFCAYGLEKKVKELKGIKKVNIDMETGVLTFSYPAEKRLSMGTIEQQVEAAGYTPIETIIKRGDGRIEKSEQSTITKNVKATVTKEGFFVAGNCDMCKARIEKAANRLDGVTKANWNKETKEITVEFEAKKVSAEQIATAIAKAGHDTKTARAVNDTYDDLPACCLYDRLK